jgi:hypothetical protein
VGVSDNWRWQSLSKGQGIVLNYSTEELIKLLLSTTSGNAVNAADVIRDELEF